METIRADLELMGSPINDEDFKIHVLNNLPKEYKSIVEKLIPDIKVLDVSNLREELQSKYQRIIKYNDGKEEATKEQALMTSQPFRKFKGKCLKCGKRGHKAADCRSGERFQGNCHYCSKPGHCIA